MSTMHENKNVTHAATILMRAALAYDKAHETQSESDSSWCARRFVKRSEDTISYSSLTSSYSDDDEDADCKETFGTMFTDNETNEELEELEKDVLKEDVKNETQPQDFEDKEYINDPFVKHYDDESEYESDDESEYESDNESEYECDNESEYECDNESDDECDNESECKSEYECDDDIESKYLNDPIVKRYEEDSAYTCTSDEENNVNQKDTKTTTMQLSRLRPRKRKQESVVGDLAEKASSCKRLCVQQINK